MVESTGFSGQFDESVDRSLLSILDESSGPNTPAKPDPKKLKAMAVIVDQRPPSELVPVMNISPVISARSDSFLEDDIPELQAQVNLKRLEN
jgi:hypothetical protein